MRGKHYRMYDSENVKEAKQEKQMNQPPGFDTWQPTEGFRINFHNSIITDLFMHFM